MALFIHFSGIPQYFLKALLVTKVRTGCKYMFLPQLSHCTIHFHIRLSSHCIPIFTWVILTAICILKVFLIYWGFYLNIKIDATWTISLQKWKAENSQVHSQVLIRNCILYNGIKRPSRVKLEQIFKEKMMLLSYYIKHIQ